MIQFDKALKIIDESVQIIKRTEIILTEDCRSRILDKDYKSKFDSPRFDKASMDDVHPRKKAAALVKEVMEIEAPAWIIPCYILFSIESLGFV